MESGKLFGRVYKKIMLFSTSAGDCGQELLYVHIVIQNCRMPKLRTIDTNCTRSGIANNVHLWVQ